MAALLSESHRREFLAPRVGRDRQYKGSSNYLAGVGRDHAIDVVLAGLTRLRVCEPYPIVFAPDSYWRGETHRTCNVRAFHRLLEEVAAAAVVRERGGAGLTRARLRARRGSRLCRGAP